MSTGGNRTPGDPSQSQRKSHNLELDSPALNAPSASNDNSQAESDTADEGAAAESRIRPRRVEEESLEAIGRGLSQRDFPRPSNDKVVQLPEQVAASMQLNQHADNSRHSMSASTPSADQDSALELPFLSATRVILSESQRAQFDTAFIRWKFDPVRNVFESVSAEAATLGYDLERWYEPGFFREIMHPDDRDAVFEACAGLVDSREQFRMRYRIVAADGQVRWIDSIIFFEVNREGKPIKHGFFIDVSDQQEAVAAVVESESFYRTLFDSIADGLLVKDRLGRIINVNFAGLDILGVTEEELKARPRFDAKWGVIDSDGSELSNDSSPSQTSLESGLPIRNQIISVLRGDGRRIWLNVNSQPLAAEGGEPYAVAVSFTDISELRNAQHRLEWVRRTSDMQRERLELAVQGANLGTWDWNPQTNVAIYNETWAKQIGYTLAELRPTGDEARQRIHLEDRQETQKAMNAVLDGSREVYECTFRMKHRYGHWLWFNARGRVVERNQQGEVTRVAGIQQDVTAMKERELQLQRLRVQAELASRAKTQFLANMSHEIRTPLTSILGWAELLLQDPEAFEDAEQRVDALTTIHRAGEHLLDVINEILDLTRIESGAVQIDFAPVDPKQLLIEVEELLKQRAETKGLHYSTLFETSMPANLQTDKTRLRQVLINLIGNSVKFTESGDIRVVARQAVEHLGGVLQIDVIDTGAGITPEAAKTIFESFSQADESMTRQHGGTGLGLTISKRLTLALGGDLELVESHIGKGSRFRITLPLQPQPEGITATKKPQGNDDWNLIETVQLDSDGLRLDSVGEVSQFAPIEEASTAELPTHTGQRSDGEVLTGGRVLLVDDGEDNRRLISYMLTQAGAQVDAAEDGVQAFEHFIAAKNRGLREYDLIVTDIQMPHMNGLELTTSIRALGDETPIIALTAHAMEDEQQECLAAGCSDFASKPVSRGDFLEQCRFWIDMQRNSLP